MDELRKRWQFRMLSVILRTRLRVLLWSERSSGMAVATQQQHATAAKQEGDYIAWSYAVSHLRQLPACSHGQLIGTG
jgi:hypothetical protein